MSSMFRLGPIAPRASLLMVLGLLAFAAPAFAQQTGAIDGKISNGEGAAIAGASVTLSSPVMLGGDRTETTSENGDFRFLKLSPGAYKITITAEGYTTFEREGISVSLGETAELDVSLAKSGEEVIEVTAGALVVDTRKVDTSQTFTAEFIQNVPSGRDYQSVATFAPGVSGSGNPNMHGGSFYSNQYLIDGVNTTDPTTNTFSLNFNFDAIDEVQVLTGGFHPRYGNVSGGIINLVTKSGSNEFNLDASVYYQGRILQIDSFDEQLLPEDKKRDFSSIQANLNVGGPILKDHLWYFVSMEYNNSTSQLPAISPVPELDGVEHPERVYQSFYWLAKLTGAIDRHNKLQLLLQADPTTIENSDQDATASPDTETHQDQGGFTGKLEWSADYDPITFHIKGAYHRSFLDIFPENRTKSSSPFRAPGVFGFGELSDKNDFGLAPGCLGADDRADPSTLPASCTADVQASPQFGNGYHYNIDNGVASVGSISDSFIVRTRTEVEAEANYFLDDVAGDHQIDVGFQLTLKGDTERERNPGGATFFVDADLDGDGVADPYYARVTAGDNNEIELETKGTVYAAYLADTWQFLDRFTLQPGIRFEKATHEDYKGNAALDFFTISPRIGFSVDPFDRGTTRVYGGYGRLYETGNLSLSKFVGTSLQTRLAFYDEETGRYSEVPGRESIRGGEAGTTINKDALEPMYTDEFRIGIEQALADAVSVGALFVHRHTQNAWEDDEANLIWNRAGTATIGSYAGDYQQTFRLTKIADSQRTYDSLEFTVAKQLTEHWAFNGSYTLAWSTGTSSRLLTVSYDNPRQNSYLDGPMPDDHRHMIKAQGYYQFDFGLQLGATFEFESGGSYDKYFFSDDEGDYSLRRAPRGRDPGNDLNDPEDDKLLRLPDYTRVDVRIAYDFEPLTGQKIELIGNIFNVLNLNTVTGVQEAFTDDGSWGLATNYQSPFRAELGLRYRY